MAVIFQLFCTILLLAKNCSVLFWEFDFGGAIYDFGKHAPKSEIPKSEMKSKRVADDEAERVGEVLFFVGQNKLGGGFAQLLKIRGNDGDAVQ